MGNKTNVSIQAIAKRLIEKNSNITALVENATDGTSYKVLAPVISARLCTSIGKTEGQFIRRNELIWACINEVQGEVEDLEY